jgi:hypothetical protein
MAVPRTIAPAAAMKIAMKGQHEQRPKACGVLPLAS